MTRVVLVLCVVAMTACRASATEPQSAAPVEATAAPTPAATAPAPASKGAALTEADLRKANDTLRFDNIQMKRQAWLEATKGNWVEQAQRAYWASRDTYIRSTPALAEQYAILMKDWGEIEAARLKELGFDAAKYKIDLDTWQAVLRTPAAK